MVFHKVTISVKSFFKPWLPDCINVWMCMIVPIIFGRRLGTEIRVKDIVFFCTNFLVSFTNTSGLEILQSFLWSVILGQWSWLKVCENLAFHFIIPSGSLFCFIILFFFYSFQSGEKLQRLEQEKGIVIRFMIGHR